MSCMVMANRVMLGWLRHFTWIKLRKCAGTVAFLISPRKSADGWWPCFSKSLAFRYWRQWKASHHSKHFYRVIMILVQSRLGSRYRGVSMRIGIRKYSVVSFLLSWMLVYILSFASPSFHDTSLPHQYFVMSHGMICLWYNDSTQAML